MQDIIDAIATDILAGNPMQEFRDRLPFPETAYQVQEGVAQKLATAKGGIAGYKIAWNLPALMEKFRISEPGAAYVMGSEVRQGHADLSAGDYMNFMVEPELLCVLGADMAPRSGGYDRQSAAACVARIVPSFELLDRRQGAPEHPPSLMANNIFNAGAVIGGPGAAPADIDIEALQITVTQDGEEIVNGTATYPQHPLDALAFVANHFTARGRTLKAGEFVLCGSHTPLIPIEGEGRMRMSVEGLGEASFAIA